MQEAHQLVLTRPPTRLSRDEMNLAEFPLTVLSTRSNPKIKTLEFSDCVKNKNGEVIDRKWIITGADKFGLPTASDDEVLLGLLKLTVDDGMKNPKIFFTRYEILKTLRWSTEGRSYTRLQRALDRLSGVRIKATNAFYDNDSKQHSTKNFGILDAYEINDGHEGKKSFFIWSEVLFKSFQVGFIKKLDLDFYLRLQSAVSKRIYRFLDKHFWYRSKVQMNLLIFAHEKIGISRNYRFLSSIRQQIDPAIEELISLGFLSGCEYVGKGSQAEIVLYAGREKPREAVPLKAATVKPQIVATVESETPKVKANETQQFEDIQGQYRKVFELLVERGIKSHQVEKLLSEKTEETLERITCIIQHFDELRARDSQKVSRSPTGFLYRAVEKPYDFVLPNEVRASQTGFSFEQNRSRTVAVNAQNNFQPRHNHYASRPVNRNRSENFQADSKPSRVGDRRAGLESQFLIERKKKIQELRQNVESIVLDGIRNEVRLALVKLKGLISDSRFEEAVEHGVEEKLAKLFAFPSFDEWLSER